MKIEKLKVGMVVKNYKELCKIIGIRNTGGDTKKANIKEIKRFVDYEMQGYKFIIKEIYKFPKNKIDKRNTSNNRSEYTMQFQQLILDLLSKQNNKKLELISITKLLKSIEMVNNKYNRNDFAISVLSKSMKIEKDLIYDFYSETQNILRRHVETALRILDKKMILKYEIGVAVCKKVNIGEKGKDVFIQSHQRATRQEREDILEYEKEILKEYGAETRQQILLAGLWSPFQSKVNSLLKENSGIMYYYNCYDIVYSNEAVIQELETIEIDTIKQDLNNKIIKQLNRSANTRAKRSRRNTVDKERFSNFDVMRCNFDYEKNNEQLANTTVRLRT